MELTEQDKRFLLRVAREAIQARLADTPYEPPVAEPHLYERGAAFVTLHKNGDLRGCIGEVEATRALIESVRRNALNAAFDDPRFPALSPKEMPHIDIEISCLTEPIRVKAIDEIELGRHGIILEKRGHRALFLPQVALEFGWDLPTTLSHLAAKAGLERDEWRCRAAFSVFEAIVFGEAT